MAALQDASSSSGLEEALDALELLPCEACACHLPPDLFSKSQRKKLAAGQAGKCSPCTQGVPPPARPATAPATPEQGYCLTSNKQTP